jgi:hypothetical protein
MIVFIVILLLLAAAVGTAYYYYTQTLPEPSIGPSAPGPSVERDVIVITENGSSRTESYIIMPRMRECTPGRSNKPSWCADITTETEMNYVYDPVGGGIDNNGNFTTSFNTENNVCSDGTQDCVFEEKFDSERKLIGITNAKGEDFIKKITDDIWSKRLSFDKIATIDGSETSVKEMMKQMIDFDRENGKLTLSRGGKSVEIIPGIEVGNQQVQDKLKMSVGTMILYIIFYYYSNNLPKPIIKLNLKSEETLGQVFEELQSATETTTDSTTEEYMIR